MDQGKEINKYEGILFFDLDGTLLENRSDSIPESAMKAIDSLRGKYVICICTGRDMESQNARKYAEMVDPDIIIHQNGTKITKGEEELFRHAMDAGLLHELYEYSAKKGFCMGFSHANGCYYTIPEIKTASDIAWRGFCDRHYLPFEEVFEKKIPIAALSFAGDIPKVKSEVERDFPQLTLFAFNSGLGADVAEKGYTKADGVRRVQEYYGIPKEKTYAFGDSPNDIPMFEAAGTSVAMGNADERAKEKADMVTDDITKDGIRNALLKLGILS